MNRRLPPALLVVVVPLLIAGLTVWRTQLFTVARPGERPRPLALLDERKPVKLDAVLPSVPIGMVRLQSGGEILLIHYWAPWEQHSRGQAAGLDSLRQLLEPRGLHAVIVCFDPFPSVARFVGRQRLRVSVLLDGERQLRRVLPCPSVPYTFVIDRSGGLAVQQAGEVEWLSRGTYAVLDSLLREEPGAATAPIASPQRLKPHGDGPWGFVQWWS